MSRGYLKVTPRNRFQATPGHHRDYSETGAKTPQDIEKERDYLPSHCSCRRSGKRLLKIPKLEAYLQRPLFDRGFRTFRDAGLRRGHGVTQETGPSRQGDGRTRSGKVRPATPVSPHRCGRGTTGRGGGRFQNHGQLSARCRDRTADWSASRTSLSAADRVVRPR